MPSLSYYQFDINLTLINSCTDQANGEEKLLNLYDTNHDFYCLKYLATTHFLYRSSGNSARFWLNIGQSL